MANDDLGRHNKRVFQYYENHGFISYNKNDSNAALLINKTAQGHGIRLWLDLDPGDHDLVPRLAGDPRGRLIEGGEDEIERTLKEAIEASIILVIISSAHSLQSIWVRKEVRFGIESGKPLFLWHVTDPDAAERTTIRSQGSPRSGSAGQMLEDFADNAMTASLANEDAIAFTMKQLEAKGSGKGKNVIGHVIRGLAEVGEVFSDLNTLIEVSELILSSHKIVNRETLLEYWPTYTSLIRRTEKLRAQIESQLGKRIVASRKPSYSPYFGLKRPFVETRLEFYRHLLEGNRDGTVKPNDGGI